MADPAAKHLDDLSANLAEVLRHADALLDEWARFGASVRAEVEREARHVAAAVGGATGAAIERAASAQLANLRVEVAQLEQRVRAASRIVAEQHAHDRRLLGGIAAGVAVAIALLVVLVARGPSSAPAAAPLAPEPVRIEPASVPPPDARPIDAAIDAPAPPPPDAARPPRHR